MGSGGVSKRGDGVNLKDHVKVCRKTKGGWGPGKTDNLRQTSEGEIRRDTQRGRTCAPHKNHDGGLEQEDERGSTEFRDKGPPALQRVKI